MYPPSPINIPTNDGIKNRNHRPFLVDWVLLFVVAII